MKIRSHAIDELFKDYMAQYALVLIYDGECPFCSQYVKISKIKKTVGNLCLLNARENLELVNKLRIHEVSIDRGIVAYYAGYLYQGAESMILVSRLSSGEQIVNRSIAAIFKNERLTRTLYPLLLFGRNLVLKIKRVKKIH